MPRCVNTHSSGSTNWWAWAPETMATIVSNSSSYLRASDLIAATSTASETPAAETAARLGPSTAPRNLGLPPARDTPAGITESHDKGAAIQSGGQAVASIDSSDARKIMQARSERRMTVTSKRCKQVSMSPRLVS